MSDVATLDARLYVNGEAISLSVRAVRGREAISELFRFEVDLHGEDEAFEFDGLVGAPAHLVVSWGSVERHVDGILSHFEQLASSEEGAFYRAEIAPQALLANLGAGCRVFPNITVPELLSSVLAEHGIDDVRLALSETYARREIIVQYGESDFALLSRWMEVEGIRYFFEHRSDGHTLVITDAATTHDEIDGGATLTYRKESLDAGENALSFELARRLAPSRVTVRDYPLTDPRSVAEEEASAEAGGAFSRFDFPARNAKKALEALSRGERVGRGKASTIRLAPGRVFALEGHARASFNDRWLLTAVEHDARLASDGKSSYLQTFESIPATTAYRPAQKTPWPRIVGAQLATVTGPEGAEIHADEGGRALVVFHWDQSATNTWVPLSQIAASQGFGTIHLPRVGDRVLVEFLDGDADRPVITGRLYHKVNVHPYTLPGSSTKTVFRDASSPGGEGYNELTFDAAKGAEEVYLRAERDSRIEVQNDATRSVGNDDKLSVDGARTVAVAGTRTTTIGEDDGLDIGGAHVVSVGANQSIDVSGDRTLEVAGDLDDAVEGDRTTNVGGDDALQIEGDATATITGSRFASVGGDDVAVVTGSRAESVEGNRQIIVEGQTFESHGSLFVSVTGEASFSYGGDLKMESSTVQKLGAPKVYIAAGTNLYLRAIDSIVLEVGNSKLTISDGKVTVTNGGSEKTLSGDTIYLNC